jgi:hypothetical protein
MNGLKLQLTPGASLLDLMVAEPFTKAGLVSAASKYSGGFASINNPGSMTLVVLI